MQNLGRQRREIAEVWIMVVTASCYTARSPDGAKRNPGPLHTAPDFAEPVITVRAQLRSSRGAHSRDPLAPSGLRSL